VLVQGGQELAQRVFGFLARSEAGAHALLAPVVEVLGDVDDERPLGGVAVALGAPAARHAAPTPSAPLEDLPAHISVCSWPC
jgi:hypothetical protein